MVRVVYIGYDIKIGKGCNFYMAICGSKKGRKILKFNQDEEGLKENSKILYLRDEQKVDHRKCMEGIINQSRPRARKRQAMVLEKEE